MTDLQENKLRVYCMIRPLFGDFGLDLWSRTRTIWSWTINVIWSWSINIIWSWTINDLKEFSKSNAPGPYLKCTCSRSMLQHALGACAFKYGPGAFDLEHSFRLLMVQDHMILMLQDHINGPGP